MAVTPDSRRSFEASHAINRRSHDDPPHGIPPSPDDPDAAHAAPLHERVVRILTDTGFPFLLIEQGQVVLSGFIVTIEPDGDVRVHWMGAREVNSLPYRRTFLGAYASTLRQAGLKVAYVENAGEPYLLCQSGPPAV
jgi:hypothetical protein